MDTKGWLVKAGVPKGLLDYNSTEACWEDVGRLCASSEVWWKNFRPVAGAVAESYIKICKHEAERDTGGRRGF